ncbi:MAG: hypothetical protein SNJ75_14195 [Gemmataceae bacterium]
MRRFVLLRHDYPMLHWDLLLEIEPEAPCPTWRLEAIPTFDTIVPAVRLPDHRAHYLTYEGPVSGDRGFVWRERWGHYQLLYQESGRLELHLFEAGGESLLTLAFVSPLTNCWTAHLREVRRPSEVSP